MARSFEDLVVWQRALDLSVDVYTLGRTGRLAKDLAIRDQLRRASVSVISNIAEGFERHSHKEFANYLSIARGSVGEVRAQLHLTRRLGYITADEFRPLYRRCVEVTRLLAALRRSLRPYTGPGQST